MKLKKLVQVMALSGALAFNIPTQQAHASAAIASGGAVLPVIGVILWGVLGALHIVPFITSATLGLTGLCIEECIDPNRP